MPSVDLIKKVLNMPTGDIPCTENQSPGVDS
jgi:hypothetical protein